MLRIILWLPLLYLLIFPASAADPCPLLRNQVASADVAARVAAVACKENQDWFRPFIDADGRAGGQSVYEAEASRLGDGSEAWRKVASYWSESGLLDSAFGRAGAGECAYAATAQYASPACRAFVVDTPWSGAFVSWVMRRAGVPGFRHSSSHVDYVRQAYRDPARSPYLVQAPQSAKPAPGDLLCSVRGAARVFGFPGLAALLSEGNGGLAMHCDIVVGAERGAMAWLVGGNVQQAVTLRMLRLDANGYFADLPTRTPADPECTPDAPANCNANRQDWVVVLKLRPQAELAQLGPVTPPGQYAPGSGAVQGASRCVTVGDGAVVCSTPSVAPVQPKAEAGPPAQPTP